MRIFDRAIYLSILLCLFTGLTIGQDTKKDNKLDLNNLPDIEGWTKTGITKFPQAELGSSRAYRSPAGGVVSVYVYSGGQKSIPNGADSKAVKDEVDGFVEQLDILVDQGFFDSYKIADKSRKFTLGGEKGNLEVYGVRFGLVRQGQNRTSETIVFGLDNHFVKFRWTRGEDIEGIENEAVTSFKAAIDAYFSKKTKEAEKDDK